MSKYASWKPQECAVLAQLARDGLTAPQIAAKMGRSAQSIYFKAHRMGLALKRASPGAWAERRENAAARRENPQQGWSGADEVELHALVALHGEANVLLIARIMGRERSAVEKKILMMQIRPSAPVALRLRACLCCGVKFRSQGAHHRMCAPCRGGNGLPDMWQGTA